MQFEPQLNSIFTWHYEALAKEAQDYARAVNDPDKKWVFERLAATYLKLAAAGPQEIAPKGTPT